MKATWSHAAIGVVTILGLATALLSCEQTPAKAPVTMAAGITWSYEVAVAADFSLAVEATFRGPLEGELDVDEAATKFVEGLTISGEQGFHAFDPKDPAWRASCEVTCRFRYRVRLAEAAEALADVDTALLSGGAMFAPPSTWLLRPSTAPAKGTYRFHVALPSGMRFETGVRPAKGAPPETYEAPLETMDESSFAAFGALRVAHVGEPDLAVVSAPKTPLSDEELARWTKTELAVVTEYLGRFSEDRARLFVAPGTSDVMRGKTLGGGGASVFLRVGKKIDRGNLLDDWVLPHELLHVGFPSLDRRSAWFAEGLASYVEPVARAQSGMIPRDKFWADLVEGLPQGQPKVGDAGLEGSTDIDRIYWGGSLYFLLADIRIREKTANSRSLQDALRAVVASGANVESHWTLQRVLDAGDAATGKRVLNELYVEHGHAPLRVDLADLWKRLGVRKTASGITFDNEAPLAAVRRAITK